MDEQDRQDLEFVMIHGATGHSVVPGGEGTMLELILMLGVGSLSLGGILNVDRDIAERTGA